MFTSKSSRSSEGKSAETLGKPWVCSQTKNGGKQWLSSRNPLAPSLVGISVRTAPLNWVVGILKQKKRTAESVFSPIAYLDKLGQVCSYIKNNYPDLYGPLLFEQIKRDLELSNGDDTSTWFLTRMKKHPLFRKTVSMNSIKSLRKGNSIGQISTKRQKANKTPTATRKQRNAPIKMVNAKESMKFPRKTPK